MSNIVQFPLSSGGAPSRASHVGARLLKEPPAHAHAVQLYDDESFLFETVALFLRTGLDAGDAAVVVATPAHVDGILAKLADPLRERAIESGQLVLLDAEAMLARFMLGDQPNESLFVGSIERLLQSLGAKLAPGRSIRAFGEMVDLLWQQGKSLAAIQLEDLWNQVGERHELQLLCAYTMGNFYKSDDAPQFARMCRQHTHVLPTERFARVEGDGFERLRDISVLEQRARLLQNEVQYRQELESALREALGECSRAELELRTSSERAREARALVRASHRVEDELVRMLEPFHAVLTTSRLLDASRELSLDPTTFARLAAMGGRLQRMVEQMLALARHRRSDEVSPRTRVDGDFTALVASVVDEAQREYPTCRFEFAGGHTRFAPVEWDRLRQVILELTRNAAIHGAQDRPIRVALVEQGSDLTIQVHNHGRPIAESLLPLLFEPSQPSNTAPEHSLATGLGLYVAGLIVAEQGGKIEVTSSAEHGTSFEVRLPRSG